MNNAARIQSFFSVWKNILIQNPNFVPTNDTFYNALEYYNMKEEDIVSLEGDFLDWENHFASKKEHIDVYRDNRQYAFLQFYNARNVNHNTEDPYKIYVSFDKDSMNACVKRLFDYLASMDARQCSKVAKNTRTDAVVLRLYDEDVAMAAINFINNDPFLSAHTIETNPFVPNFGGCAVAMDKMLSYNSTISYILSKYFNYLKKNNKLQFSGNEVRDFREFIANFKEQLFNQNNILNSINDPYIKDYSNRRYNGNNGATLYNIEQIIDLLYKACSDEPAINYLPEHFRKANDANFVQSNRNKYNQMIAQQQSNVVNYGNSVSYEEKVNLVDEYIKVAKQKYGAYNGAIQLRQFIYTQNNYNAITSTNNLRERFRFTFKQPSDVLEVTGDDVIGYFNNRINAMEVTDVYQIFMSACMDTIMKYGTGQLEFAIKKAINEKSYDGFTSKLYANDSKNNKLLLTNYVNTSDLTNIMDAILTHYDVTRSGDLLGDFMFYVNNSLANTQRMGNAR